MTQEAPFLPLSLLDERADKALRKQGYRTFVEWQERGRHVVAGNKATGFNSKGEALFHRRQTGKTGVDIWAFADEECDWMGLSPDDLF